ncbi:MAG: magnesium/cobalt transporter CorA [Nitrosarchaeum sp.]|nr:magnesium/cobalt transporter CorA [Nitrosarchaeum sp.]
MKHALGVVLNRLTIGFTFAFLYQITVGIATSVFSLPLTGNVQDLIVGIQKIESGQGLLFIFWWIISTIIITMLALVIVRYKKFLCPYKKEAILDIPPKITILTPIIIGGIISFLFFLTDLVIGLIVKVGSSTDVQAIYQAAINGDVTPLAISIFFSILAGFIVLGITGKTRKVEQITPDVTLEKFTNLAKKVSKKSRITKTSDTIGLHPGALVHVGQKKVEKVTFSVIEYNEKEISEDRPDLIDGCFTEHDKSKIHWINVNGIHDSTVIEKFGSHYNLHPLVQADIMNSDLRPKIEITENYIFLIVKMPHFTKSGELLIEQLSIIIGTNYVLTFQEEEGDIFDSLRGRIRNSVGNVRKLKSDYLGYALIDAIVDNYFAVMEKLGEISEEIEEALINNPTPSTLQTIHRLKRQLVMLRKTIWPIREVIDNLERSDTIFIHKATKTYLRDVYSHAIQIMDTVESARDLAGGMLDTYLSTLSNKMNEVMKTLTIIASIFIPITFIAGVYGTNFDYIPELSWNGSYFTMLAVMAVVALTMMMWFKKKRWV